MNRCMFLLLIFLSSIPLCAQSTNNTVLPVIPSNYFVDLIADYMFKPPSATQDLVLLSAHRGSWEVYPENSAYALQDAWNRGIETVEVDVRFTSDKQIVLSHDYKIDRESTGTGLLYNIPYATLQTYNLRDRHGRPYKDSAGRSAQFLTFTQALSVLQSYITSDGHGYVMIVDVKGAVDDQDPTDPLELLKDCIAALSAFNNPQLTKAVVFKVKSKDAGTFQNLMTATGFTSSAAGGFIRVMNPDDATVTAASYNPANDSTFVGYTDAPFSVQFEMNQFYKGDGLQNYFSYSSLSAGLATYHESNYYPEGVANSAGVCCFAHTTNPTATATGGIVPDYRGDPEMSVVNPTALITTDWPDVVGAMLAAQGRRNTAQLQVNP